MIRKHIVFTGRVQHVGFRWRARKAALALHCTGWCRNEEDGSVTMEIQGKAVQIDLVIMALRAGKYIRIDHMDTRVLPVVPDESGFHTD